MVQLGSHDPSTRVAEWRMRCGEGYGNPDLVGQSWSRRLDRALRPRSSGPDDLCTEVVAWRVAQLFDEGHRVLRTTTLAGRLPLAKRPTLHRWSLAKPLAGQLSFSFFFSLITKVFCKFNLLKGTSQWTFTSMIHQTQFTL